MNIVSTDKTYTYDLLTQNLFTLNRTFPFLDIQVVGSSVLGKNLYVVTWYWFKKNFLFRFFPC